MISLDTNVVVRLVTEDDPQQASTAFARMQAEHLWLPKSVLLELEWVLRFCYQIDRETVHEIFLKLLGLRNLIVEDFPAAVRALRWFETGMDFADALHLASSQPADQLATFDRTLAGVARSLRTEPPVDLLRSP